MRYGLLSDVHANLPALTAAVRRLSELGVDRWLCAGDVIDYGPQPNECVAELAALDPVCIVGNHELAALGELPDDRYSPRARASLAWTRTVLTDDSRRWLAALPPLAEVPGVVMAHGSLTDPEEYVRREDQAEAQLDLLAAEHPGARVLVLGHTHRAWLYRQGRDSVSGTIPDAVPARAAGQATEVTLAHESRYLVNPGSVGQSRQRERRPLARCALLEVPESGPAAITVRFLAVPYDHRAVRAALRRERLPLDSVHVRPGALARLRRTLARHQP